MLDPFTEKRLLKFLSDHRAKTGQLPTLKDFDLAGFSGDAIKDAIKRRVIEEFYVTLTSGTIVKGYKQGSPD